MEIKRQNVQPTISTENKTENIILLKITHPKVIEKVEYGWNDEEKTVVNGKWWTVYRKRNNNSFWN